MYASNKRTRASKGVDEMRKVLDELENKPPLVEGKTLGILVFLRNQLRRIERRAEAEDRRRREDQEEVLAAERFECREGKHV
ncbi:hypothetical protein PC119_g13491 [Phytophthora cactorum]|uniref:Uncharacterized protein n=1 Tax=Phytophthora cactorum TaxID=29920 RepID=A0A8T1D4Z3_9STRA|nr:hypothetical protein PC117_g13202 [Phytophthora cactorum]KAG3010514.1 hypothetical protein PC119_g13491 [Phytophthora cactorum]KAG3031653.1 hypothetical protein PC120_g3003 [Phytophthora cactorum]KAG3158832.1 hypothetical protein C6341_g14287 [Phytophthora cactorum]